MSNHKRNEIALGQARHSLEEAHTDLSFVKDNQQLKIEISIMQFEIMKLVNKCLELEYRASEKYEENK